jgi:hypothetical protein
MDQELPSNRVELTLPLNIECALFQLLRHYWGIEQKDYTRLPEHRRIGHIFETIRLLDEWVFRPTGMLLTRGMGGGNNGR